MLVVLQSDLSATFVANVFVSLASVAFGAFSGVVCVISFRH